jgi:hypothetical protein
MNSIHKVASKKLAQPQYQKLLADWKKASDRLSSDYDGAITAARSLLETTCKYVLDETDSNYAPADDLPKLYGLASTELGIAASKQTDQLFKSMFGAAHTVVQAVGELRNKIGDAHGKGKGASTASHAQAELAVNLAGSMASFLLSTLAP